MSGRAIKEELKYTYHDYCLFPEDKRYEIIDGDAYMVSAPLTRHQRILMNLLSPISEYLKVEPKGIVLPAPVDVVLTDHDIVQPDILFISNERQSILTEANIQGAPDWVIEILSPSSIERDRDLKLKLYSRHAVKEYWIVDPEQYSVEVYAFEYETLSLKQSVVDGIISSKVLPSLQISVDEVFSNTRT